MPQQAPTHAGTACTALRRPPSCPSSAIRPPPGPCCRHAASYGSRWKATRTLLPVTAISWITCGQRASGSRPEQGEKLCDTECNMALAPAKCPLSAAPAPAHSCHGASAPAPGSTYPLVPHPCPLGPQSPHLFHALVRVDLLCVVAALPPRRPPPRHHLPPRKATARAASEVNMVLGTLYSAYQVNRHDRVYCLRLTSGQGLGHAPPSRFAGCTLLGASFSVPFPTSGSAHHDPYAVLLHLLQVLPNEVPAVRAVRTPQRVERAVQAVGRLEADACRPGPGRKRLAT